MKIHLFSWSGWMCSAILRMVTLDVLKPLDQHEKCGVSCCVYRHLVDLTIKICKTMVSFFFSFNFLLRSHNVFVSQWQCKITHKMFFYQTVKKNNLSNHVAVFCFVVFPSFSERNLASVKVLQSQVQCLRWRCEEHLTDEHQQEVREDLYLDCTLYKITCT